MDKSLQKLGATLLLTLLWQCTSLGQGVVFTDRAAFIAAAQGLGNVRQVDFESGLPPSTGFPLGFPNYFGSVAIGGLTFSGRELDVRSDICNPIYGSVMNNYDGGLFTISMPGGAQAFGADYSDFVGHTVTMTLTLTGGEIYTFQCTGNPNMTFFGFVAASPFTSLVVSDGGAFGGPVFSLHEEIIDNIYVAGVPEPTPGALVLFGSGLLWLMNRHCWFSPLRRPQSPSGRPSRWLRRNRGSYGR